MFSLFFNVSNVPFSRSWYPLGFLCPHGGGFTGAGHYNAHGGKSNYTAAAAQGQVGLGYIKLNPLEFSY